MKEYRIDAHIHIRGAVWAENGEELYDIVENMLDGTREGIYEVLDINGKMQATGLEDEEDEEEEE